MITFTEWRGKPPSSTRSSCELPVLTRSIGHLSAVASEQKLHRLHQPLVAERLAHEGIGTRFTGALLGGQDAEDEDDDRAGGGIGLERAADAQAVHAADQDLGHH